MKKFTFIGGEYIEPTVPESFVTFDYSLFATDRKDAVEKFHTIFPGCVLVEVK